MVKFGYHNALVLNMFSIAAMILVQTNLYTGLHEHPAIMNRFLCVNITDCSVKKFGYNEHPMIMSSFFCIFLLVVSGPSAMDKDTGASGGRGVFPTDQTFHNFLGVFRNLTGNLGSAPVTH